MDLKVGRGLSSPPKLATLPPTTEAFGKNVAASRYLKECSGDSSQLPMAGNKIVHNSLMPTSVPEGTLFAPVQLLRCSCESDIPPKLKLIT